MPGGDDDNLRGCREEGPGTGYNVPLPGLGEKDYRGVFQVV